MFAVLFTLLILCVVLGGYGVFVYDTNPDALRTTVKRMSLALVVALLIAGRLIYAAEIRPTTCNDLEKYSFLWYANFCFIYESSS